MIILNKLICLLKGHNYEPVYRNKYYFACNGSFYNGKSMKCHLMNKIKCKYFKCQRCNKRITVTKAKSIGLNYCHIRPFRIKGF